MTNNLNENLGSVIITPLIEDRYKFYCLKETGFVNMAMTRNENAL